MKLFGMCINWKVVAGLGVVALGLFVLVSPGVARAALPYLLSAVCPLSMLLMMKSMGGKAKERTLDAEVVRGQLHDVPARQLINSETPAVAYVARRE